MMTIKGENLIQFQVKEASLWCLPHEMKREANPAYIKKKDKENTTRPSYHLNINERTGGGASLTCHADVKVNDN